MEKCITTDITLPVWRPAVGIIKNNKNSINYLTYLFILFTIPTPILGTSLYTKTKNNYISIYAYI